MFRVCEEAHEFLSGFAKPRHARAPRNESTVPQVNSDPEISLGRTATTDDWRRLRTLVHCVAISVLILTGTIFVFLYRQASLVRNNTHQMASYLQQYVESDAAEMLDKIRQRLDSYRQQDPGFNPIYVKYFGTNSSAATNFSASSATNR
jgi:hypothetical protein